MLNKYLHALVEGDADGRFDLDQRTNGQECYPNRRNEPGTAHWKATRSTPRLSTSNLVGGRQKDNDVHDVPPGKETRLSMRVARRLLPKCLAKLCFEVAIDDLTIDGSDLPGYIYTVD